MKNIEEPNKKPKIEDPKKVIKEEKNDIKPHNEPSNKKDNDDGWENHSGDIVMF